MNSEDYLKFAIDALESDPRFDDVDKSSSSGFYNLNILPFSVLLKPVYDLNMSTIDAMDLDTMTSAQLDKFGNSLFIKRKSQNYTTLEITLYFTNPSSAVEPCIITTSDEFRTSSNKVYRPLQDHIIIVDRLPLINGKRVATIMTAAYDNYAIILANSIKTTSVIHASLESVDNPSPSSTPPSEQTDEQFKLDIKQAIGSRSNTSAGPIYTNVKQNFQDVIDCLPICYGDPEMQRDIAVAAKTWSGHFGGMTDILVRTSLVPATFNINASPTVGNDGVVFTLRKYKGYDWYANDAATPNANQLMPWTLLSGVALPILPLLFINWDSTEVDTHTIALNSVGQPDYTIEVLPDPIEKSYGKNYRFSQYENVRITIKCNEPVLSTTNIRLSYYTLSNIENIQNYIADSYNRASCSNNLVKSFIPIEIKKLVVVYNPSSSFTQAEWKQNLADKINNYNSTNILYFSDLFKSFPVSVRLSEAWKGTNNLPFTFDGNGEISTVVTPTPAPGSYPTYATMIQHNIDGSKNYYASTRQLYQLKTSNGLSATSRTCRYFILPENIVFESEA